MPPLSRSARDTRPDPADARFVLYVEGPRDRDLLRVWAQRHAAPLARVVHSAVILGGRQPQRAVEHFRGIRAGEPDAVGLCVLDRDHESGDASEIDEPGLEFFVWSRRHIESYLLIPDAIRRTLSDQNEKFRMDRFFREQLPEPGDEAAYRKLDAKRILGREGALSRAVGRPIPVSPVARAIRLDELHPDVIELFGRIRRGMERVEAG